MADGLEDVAKSAGLSLLGQRPPLGPYLRETVQRLPFAATLAWYRLQADFQRNRLGIAWVVLQPVLTAAVYGIVFFFIINPAARPQPFVPFLLVGVFFFQYYAGSLANGSRAITGNTKLVQSLNFPRILLPIQETLEQAVRMVPNTVLLIVLLLIFGEPPSWSWLLIVPVLLLMSIFCLGIAFIGARIAVHFRDFQLVVSFVNRFLFFGSGILFSMDQLLADNPTMLAIVHWVPTYDFISIARAVLLHNSPTVPIVWVAAGVWAAVAFVVGLIFFWRAEVRYGLED